MAKMCESNGVPDVPGRRDLDELLDEVRDRMDEIVTTRDHMQELLGAVLAVASGLELDSTLQRIVQAAVDLVGARYGALGVLGTRDDLSEFVLRRESTSGRARRWATCRRARACSGC